MAERADDGQGGARDGRVARRAFAREAFSEYHLYSLGAADDAGRERDQADLAARRDRHAGEEAVRRRRPAVLLPEPPASRLAAQGQRRGVLQVRNDDASGLGMPMPAGIVRVYQADTKAGCSSPAKTASTTRRKTRTSPSRSAPPSTSSASGSRPTSRRLPTTCTRWRSRSRCATTRRRRSPCR